MVRKKNKSFRLLMEYHSFLYKIGSVYNKVVARKVSVSLRSYIHSYLSTTEKTIMVILLFPSPYGVIFILTETGRSIRMTNLKFPSPYRVSFILIYNTRMVNHIRCYSSVSVSLWSIIHSYWQ